MPKLETVVPTLVGRTQQSLSRVRPVPMDDSAKHAGRAIQAVGDAALRLTAYLGRVKEKEDELLFSERWNQFVAEVEKRTFDEILSQENPGDAEAKLNAIVARASERHGSDFSGVRKREFDAAVGKYKNSRASSVRAFIGQKDKEQKREDEGLRNAEHWNQFIAVVEKRIRNEVLSQENPENAEATLDSIITQEAERYGSGLSGDEKKRFDVAVGKYRNSRAGAAWSYQQNRKNKESDLLVSERLNQFTADAEAIYQEEVFSLSGDALRGADFRAKNKVRQAMARYGSGISADEKRRFDIAAGKYINARQSSVVAYRDRELTKSLVASKGREIEGFTKAFVATGDESYVEQAVEAFNMQYRQKYGNIIPKENYQQFLADVNDGDGYVRLPGGARLAIVDERKPGQTGVITRAEVQAESDRLKEMSEGYEKQRQNLSDVMWAGLVDTYLDHDEVEKAAELVEEGTGMAWANMSESALATVKTSVQRKQEVVEDVRQVDGAITKLLNMESGKDQDGYGLAVGDPDIAHRIEQFRARLSEKTDSRSKNRLRIFNERIESETRRQKAQLSAAVSLEYSRLNGLPPESQIRMVETWRKSGSPVHRAVVAVYDRSAESRNRQNDPDFLARQASQLALFQRESAAGVIKVDMVEYRFLNGDGTLNEQELHNAVHALGFTPDNAQKAIRYVRDAHSDGITYDDVKATMQGMGFREVQNLLLNFYPDLITYINAAKKRAGLKVMTGEEKRRLINDYILRNIVNDEEQRGKMEEHGFLED